MGSRFCRFSLGDKADSQIGTGFKCWCTGICLVDISWNKMGYQNRLRIGSGTHEVIRMATTNGVMRRTRPVPLRRRPSPQQGHALEILGHAIEYLMDSYLTTASPNSDRADHEAIQMLQRVNMEIFRECP